jgi:hypothetical protein
MTAATSLSSAILSSKELDPKQLTLSIASTLQSLLGNFLSPEPEDQSCPDKVADRPTTALVRPSEKKDFVKRSSKGCYKDAIASIEAHRMDIDRLPILNALDRMDIDRSPNMNALDLALSPNVTTNLEISRFLVPFRDPRNLSEQTSEPTIDDDASPYNFL